MAWADKLYPLDSDSSARYKLSALWTTGAWWIHKRAEDNPNGWTVKAWNILPPKTDSCHDDFFNYGFWVSGPFWRRAKKESRSWTKIKEAESELQQY